MTEDKYLSGIIVALKDAEFCLSEFAAAVSEDQKFGNLLLVKTKIILKSGRSFYISNNLLEVHNALIEAGRLYSK